MNNLTKKPIINPPPPSQFKKKSQSSENFVCMLLKFFLFKFFRVVNTVFLSFVLQVKFELNVQGDTVAFIEFDGRNSNYLNWFHNSRILKSSWNDMHKSQTYNFFSIDK